VCTRKVKTLADVEVQREDGWVVFFHGPDAILRVQEEHVQALERLDGSDAATGLAG
jgi:hypothetical protein